VIYEKERRIPVGTKGYALSVREDRGHLLSPHGIARSSVVKWNTHLDRWLLDPHIWLGPEEWRDLYAAVKSLNGEEDAKP
jgi:hypothetical protein